MGNQTTRRQQKKILVIDDDEGILEVVKLILIKKGYGVCTLPTGLNIQHVVASFLPDLILLDILIPGESAEEICKELKKNFSVPIILFTANPEKIMIFEECNADDLIVKPFEITELVKTIESHLKRN